MVLRLGGERCDFIDAGVDGVADATNDGRDLGIGVVFQLFEFVVEEHAAERIKCCHTSFGLPQSKKLTCFIQLSGKGSAEGGDRTSFRQRVARTDLTLSRSSCAAF